METPLVTVLTPVYNGEKYLAECIESVLAQTYAHWEYVIVNNRSTDRSLEIARGYAARDSRIRLIDNAEFVDAIANHNIALGQLSPASKYCKLIQADDWLFPECIEKMVAVAEGSPSVGVVGSYHLAGDRVRSDGVPHTTTVLPGRELCRRTLLGEIYLFWRPSCLMLRSEIVHGRQPFFRTRHLNTDVGTLYEILQHWDFGFVHQVLTFVRRHADSQTRQDARRANTQRFSRMELLKRYGPLYLSDKELEDRAGYLLDRYYRSLAKAAFERRTSEFWETQRQELARLGYPLRTGRLIGAMLGQIVANPKACLRRLGRGARASA
jgi:glycosyltransferase involved in cell wall biosynthesis